jgi:hypothetical protein
MRKAASPKADILTDEEMQTLLDAIQSNETHRKPNGLKQRIQRILYSLKLIDPPKHLINTIPDEADLPGVCQIWFNEEIQIPIWTDDKGLVCAFRIYLEKKTTRECTVPFSRMEREVRICK